MSHIMPITPQLIRHVEPFPFVPKNPETLNARCWEIEQTEIFGLAKRLRYVAEITGQKIVTSALGLSGGLDSTSVACAAAKAYDLLGWSRKYIKARTMPGVGTTSTTRSIADRLGEHLRFDYDEIPIAEAVRSHLVQTKRCVKKDGGPCFDCLTCANAQARQRTAILMNLGFVLGTSDMSELALGWCTYNADQMAMYNVQPGKPKTLVKHFVAWCARQAEQKNPELARILQEAVGLDYNPELTATPQKTEEAVGPYELQDFTLFHVIRNGFAPRKILFLQELASHVPARQGGYARAYTPQELARWMCVFYERFGPAQFKRNACADGPQYGSVALSKTGAFRGPADMDLRPWIQDLRDITKIAS